MRLVLVELTRFRSRRAIVLMLLAAALLSAVIAGTTIWETRPVSPADRAAAQAQAETEGQQPFYKRDLERCEMNPRRFLGADADAADCKEAVLPQADWFLNRSELSLAQERGDTGLAVIVIVCAFMILVGTTFAGADWASGSMSNQLLFEPRRVKVWLAKAAAVVLATLAVSIVIVCGFWLALYVAAETRDIATVDRVLERIAWMSLRGVGLSSLAALAGYALTMLLRHTVGTLAAMFAYAVGGEALTASLPFPGIGRWGLANNVMAWLQGGWDYYDETLTCGPGRGMCDLTARLTQSEGATYLLILLLIVTALSVVSFWRRDVP